MSTRQLSVNWGATGATLYFRVLDAADAVLISRRSTAVANESTGVTESPSGSGLYFATVSIWNDSWKGRVLWDDGVSFAQSSFDVPPVNVTEHLGAACPTPPIPGQPLVSPSGANL